MMAASKGKALSRQRGFVHEPRYEKSILEEGSNDPFLATLHDQKGLSHRSPDQRKTMSLVGGYLPTTMFLGARFIAYPLVYNWAPPWEMRRAALDPRHRCVDVHLMLVALLGHRRGASQDDMVLSQSFCGA